MGETVSATLFSIRLCAQAYPIKNQVRSKMALETNGRGIWVNLLVCVWADDTFSRRLCSVLFFVNYLP
jgi:hypothetical protein